MAIKEWTTSFEGANPTQDPDPISQVGLMEDLDDLVDIQRSSQVEKLRDKLQAICKLAGDSVNNPAGSLAEILDRDHANGDARFLRLRERASAPAAVADKAFLYAKDDAGTTKTYTRWSDGTELEVGSGSGGQTNTVAGSSGITNTGDNVDATLTPTYGSSASTFCEGNDARLSDSRAPTGAASGDLAGTYPGPSVAADAVGNTKLANMAQATIKGRASGAGTGDPTDLSAAQATAILDTFTSALKGVAPASGGGTTNYLRADATWASPPGGSSSPLTTKGDLWGYDTGDQRIPVGSDGQVLKADSGEALGVKWDTVDTAPAGDYIEVTDGQPTSSIDIGSGDTVIMPSQTFSTDATGDYAVRVVVPWLAVSGSGNSSIQVKAVFNESGTPITIGYTDEWQARALDGDYQCATFSGSVTLDASASHTLKIYAKEVDGSNARILGSSTKPGGAVKAVLTLITGTGVEYVQDETTDTNLETGDAKKTLTNSGAGAKVDYTLPTCSAGLRYRFVVLTAQTLRIVTDTTSDDIRIGGSITAGASRYVEASTVGNVIELLGVSDALWISVAREGTWTLST